MLVKVNKMCPQPIYCFYALIFYVLRSQTYMYEKENDFSIIQFTGEISAKCTNITHI